MKAFHRNVYNMYGSNSKAWTESLPKLIIILEKEMVTRN